jgi:hypothetical protein
MHAHRLDRLVDSAIVSPADDLAAHRNRLTSRTERAALSEALRRHARPGPAAIEELVDEVTRRLLAPGPVRARGTARLRLLLHDRHGPLHGHGSLNAALRGVLATL